MTTALLTLGRLPKALELARALHAAGVRVVVAEPLARHLCRPSRAVAKTIRTPAPASDPQGYLSALEAIIAEEGIDLVVPVSEESLYAAQIASRLPEGVRVFGPGRDTLFALHDKLQFARTARSYGLTVPETAPAFSAEADALRARVDFVVKPRDGCAGAGLHLLTRGDALPAGVGADGIVQRRIYGRLVSAFAIADAGATRAIAVYEGMRFAGSVAISFRRLPDLSAVEAWIRSFVAHAGYSGFISFDFIIDGDGTPFALECNPRVTSGVHFIQPEDLAACVLARPPAGPIRFKPQGRFQDGHTTLAAAYGRIAHPGEFLQRLREIAGARDVLWSVRDPMPFVLMTPMSFDIILAAFREKISLGEAATRDILWRSPPGVAGDSPAPARLSSATAGPISHDYAPGP